MDLTKEYRLMCLEAIEIQHKWKPEVGDFMITKSTYCKGEENEDNCSDEKPCSDCLEMGNVYVISGKYDYAESVGGTHWFYGGRACVKGESNICNDTYCSIMSESGYSTIHPSPFKCSNNDMLWLPRQDQIQDILRKYFDYTRENIRIDFHMFDENQSVELGIWTDEMLWLAFYMNEVYKKIWVINKWELL